MSAERDFVIVGSGFGRSVGVGGGSLVHANTLPIPKTQFFEAPSWARLATWEGDLGGLPGDLGADRQLREDELGGPRRRRYTEGPGPLAGGAPSGRSFTTTSIDHRHRVFGDEGPWVVDGSAMSANPGVNRSLTITALAERAMKFVPPKESGSA